MQTRQEIAAYITQRLNEESTVLQHQFESTSKAIGYFYIDNLLPEAFVLEIFKSFPKLDESVRKKDFREFKYVAYQMNKYTHLLEEVIYAFQENNVVESIAKITSILTAQPDKNLYAGGLSLMTKDNFLKPHLDNSHDKNRDLWRVLNLLFYVSPNWKLENGGNLELFPNGIQKPPLEIESKFNRLVVMATHQNSWHGVNKVNISKVRCCVSNYYFSKEPLQKSDAFHVTTFREPNSIIKDTILRADNFIRGTIRKISKKGIRENPHQYKK